MIVRVLLVASLLLSAIAGYGQEPKETRDRKPARRGSCAGYGSRDATALSRLGWGLGLGAGIATLCALIPDNSGNSHSH